MCTHSTTRRPCFAAAGLFWSLIVGQTHTLVSAFDQFDAVEKIYITKVVPLSKLAAYIPPRRRSAEWVYIVIILTDGWALL